MRVHILVLALLLMAAPAWAQPITRLATQAGSGTLTATTTSIVVNVGGMAAARIQTLDTYSGVWEVQCSVDGGTTYDTDDELALTLDGQTDVAYSVTDLVGIWTVNVAGCTHIKINANSGFSATDTTVKVLALSTGGGGGGGGSAGTVSISQTGDANAVDVLTIAAGNNNIGDVDVASIAAGDNNIGNVDVASIAAGTANIGNIDVQGDVGGTPTVITAATEGSFTGLHTILIDPVTNAAVVYGGACTPVNYVSDGTDEVEIKSSAGYLDSFSVFGINTAVAYVRIYDDDAADVDENDTPKYTFPIPLNSTATNGAGSVHSFPGGMSFANGITIRINEGIAINSTTAVDGATVTASWCYR